MLQARDTKRMVVIILSDALLQDQRQACLLQAYVDAGARVQTVTTNVPFQFPGLVQCQSVVIRSTAILISPCVHAGIDFYRGLKAESWYRRFPNKSQLTLDNDKTILMFEALFKIITVYPRHSHAVCVHKYRRGESVCGCCR